MNDDKAKKPLNPANGLDLEVEWGRQDADTPSKSSPTVLLVEDELDHLVIYQLLLEKNGYHVIGAQSVDEGLKLLETTKVDCIISDSMMPGHDGGYLLDSIRSSRKKIPVIMLTAACEDREREFYDRGADSFCPKRHAFKSLVPQVRCLLGQY